MSPAGLDWEGVRVEYEPRWTMTVARRTTSDVGEEGRETSMGWTSKCVGVERESGPAEVPDRQGARRRSGR